MAPNITYEEALNTLDSMFGHPWTQDHLDAILRHFQGHMENTVEAVLNHANGSPESLLANLRSVGSANNGISGSSGNTNTEDTSMDAEIARQLSAQMQQEERQSRVNDQTSRNQNPGFGSRQLNLFSGKKNNNAFNLNSRFDSQSVTTPSEPLKPNGKRWIGIPTDLPRDFLRLPGIASNSSASNGGGAQPDLDADEALARMLQDSLFTEELANNPEFAHLAGGRGGGGGGGFGSSNSPQFGRPRKNGNENHEGPNLLKGIADLGENAKKRLSMFAAQFNAKKNENNPNNSGERRGLLDDIMNEDNDTRNVEMKSMGFSWRGTDGKKKD